ncbi:MAG: GNAT family N-acetyltransferase [Leptospirales bacterium]|nr:GNAT family N-acetyltransferase [Leptospirales bacterium]
MEIVNINKRPDLIPTVARWYHEEWGHIRSRSYEHMVQVLQDRCVGDFPFTLVAIDQGEAVGTASLKIHDMDILQDLTPWLASVYVPPIHRGRRIAAALIGNVERVANGLGFMHLYLYTWTAATLYQKLGWLTLQELDYNGVDVVVMKKPIQVSP